MMHLLFLIVFFIVMALCRYDGIIGCHDAHMYDTEWVWNHLKKRMQSAYDFAKMEADRNAERSKQRYDVKVRDTCLEVGDIVLVRNVGLIVQSIKYLGSTKLSEKV